MSGLAGRMGLWALLAALGLGCATVEHAFEAQQYAEQLLSPKSARGAKRFQAELQVDAGLAAYVGEHGRPDYFYVVDWQKLYLVYLEGDRAALVQRALGEGSQITDLGRIPGRLLKHLPAETRRSLEASRSRSQRQAQASARRAKARQAQKPRSATGPAAPAPGGTYIGGFEVAEIVARMREPMTAADPGVKSWKHSGGVYRARSGSTHYEVGPERVAFTTPLSASRRNLPGSARVAMQRVNNAIFAARADAVTQSMIELARQAAGDRTGRTAFSRRVAGRTVRIGRRTDRGVLIYAIEP